jgi:LytS/YehU family sensor histidine kinase
MAKWRDFRGSFQTATRQNMAFHLLIYWVILAVTQAFEYYRKYRDRELQTAELEKRLVQAKLQALQMQLNPHFLFNTLHSISSLMHKDIEAADRMIVRLSDLLRAALESSDSQEVPLSRELKMLNLYLSIEQTRFGNRLTTTMDIAPDTLNAQVPNLYFAAFWSKMPSNMG